MQDAFKEKSLQFIMVKKIHFTKKFKHIRIKSPRIFDSRSFRIKDVGRKGFTRLVIGCPKNKWDSKKKRCKIGTQIQAILLNRKDFGI